MRVMWVCVSVVCVTVNVVCVCVLVCVHVCMSVQTAYPYVHTLNCCRSMV